MLAFIVQFGIIPIGLVIAAGELIRKRGNPDTARRRYFLFLVWTSLGLWALFAYLNWWMRVPGLGNMYNTLLSPVAIGVTTLTALHLGKWKELSKGQKIIIALFLLCIILTQAWFAVTTGYEQRTEPLFLEAAVLTISVILLLAWISGTRYPIGVSIAALIYLILFNFLEGGALPFFEYGVESGLAITSIALYILLPAIVISSAAMLVLDVLKLESLPTGPKALARRIGQVVLLLVLISSFLYTVVWLCIWDGTDDGVRGLMMILLSVLTSTAAGLVVAMNSVGWRRWSGFGLAILVILVVRWAVMGPGNQFHPYEITEARAAGLQKAIEEFKTTTGRYPVSLTDLIPGRLWRIPRPMIVRGQSWCYEGNQDYFRLGTIYREHWSSPYMSVRVYASEGRIPDGNWSCDEQLSQLMTQKAVLDTPPDATPQPTSIAPSERIVLEPILDADQLAVGRWSPAGKSLVFGITGYSGDSALPVQIDLRFMDGETGEICVPAGSTWKAGERSDGLYEHFAWLPDERFLYVSESGEIVILQPCVDGSVDIAQRFPVPLTHIAAFEETSGHMLLRNEESYWLLDGTDLEIRQISEVMPAATENQNDRYSWSPTGEWLAISRMNEENASEAAAIRIVRWTTGKVELSIPLTAPAEYLDAPIVDWLNENEILVQFADTLAIMDLSTKPPTATDLVRDTFLLDLSYPIDFSSLDFVRDAEGDEYYVAARANHPHNQDIYLYSSETGQVSIFQHDTDSVFFFPDGQCMRLSKWEDTPTYRDEYEVVWMDRTSDERRLIVKGHVPRTHPQLLPKCRPGSANLIFSSSQGISLVSASGGETLRFWELSSGAEISSQIYVAPSGNVLVAVADGKHLYFVPLP